MLFANASVHKTYYDILGVKENATQEEIRTSYRSALLNSHPDKLQKKSETSKSEQNESRERFLEIQQAWEILGDLNPRAVYDNKLQASRQEEVNADDITLEDLTVEDDGDTVELFHQCRCGDYFSVDSMELGKMGFGLLRDGKKVSLLGPNSCPASVVLPCGSCSLKAVLIVAEILWNHLKTQRRSSGSSKDEQLFNFQSMEDLLAFLDQPQTEEDECSVCLVIHNIDGPGLRDSETQQLLARIASCSHIHVIASIDHVNAPLCKLDIPVPTFAPYTVEGGFFTLILSHGSITQSVKTTSIVLQSLTHNAQSVFKVLVQHQLAHPDDKGMPIDVLYTSCRERFLLSSQATLNSHLTEFKDHEPVKLRRHVYPYPDQTKPNLTAKIAFTYLYQKMLLKNCN